MRILRLVSACGIAVPAKKSRLPIRDHPPCGGEVRHGVTSGVSRETWAKETASAVRCDMVLHREFHARHL